MRHSQKRRWPNAYFWIVVLVFVAVGHFWVISSYKEKIRQLEDQIHTARRNEQVMHTGYTELVDQLTEKNTALLQTQSCTQPPSRGNIIGDLWSELYSNKSIRIAVVIPYVTKQASYLFANLWSWGNTFMPCRKGSDIARMVDLVFYISRQTKESDELEAEISKFIEKSEARQCFSEVLFRNGQVVPERDNYAAGATDMVYNLFERKLIALPSYDYILYMEPDTRPVRKNWLEKVYYECATSDFWVKGSAPRYGTGDGVHINGNALYRFNSPLFTEHLLKSRGAFKQYVSFDQSLPTYLEDHRLYQYWQNYVYSDFILNFGSHECPDIQPGMTRFYEQYPNTYLVHSKGVVDQLQKIFPSPYNVTRPVICHDCWKVDVWQQ